MCGIVWVFCYFGFIKHRWCLCWYEKPPARQRTRPLVGTGPKPEVFRVVAAVYRCGWDFGCLVHRNGDPLGAFDPAEMDAAAAGISRDAGDVPPLRLRNGRKRSAGPVHRVLEPFGRAGGRIVPVQGPGILEVLVFYVQPPVPAVEPRDVEAVVALVEVLVPVDQKDRGFGFRGLRPAEVHRSPLPVRERDVRNDLGLLPAGQAHAVGLRVRTAPAVLGGEDVVEFLSVVGLPVAGYPRGEDEPFEVVGADAAYGLYAEDGHAHGLTVYTVIGYSMSMCVAQQSALSQASRTA